jgi:hypothetical protein
MLSTPAEATLQASAAVLSPVPGSVNSERARVLDAAVNEAITRGRAGRRGPGFRVVLVLKVGVLGWGECVGDIP